MDYLLSLATNSAILYSIFLLLVWSKKVSKKTALAFSGCIAIIVYVICIAVPFYFQGYSDLENVTPGDALGWNSLYPIGLFAYLYTFKANGYTWLVISLLLIGYGSFSSKKLLDFTLKFACLIAASFLLLELHKYTATINMILE